MTEVERSLIDAETKIKVSTTLDKSVGKKHLTDGDPGTCWTSQQGIPQYIQLQFPAPVVPSHLSMTFQGGFVGTKCRLEVLTQRAPHKGEWQLFAHVFPEDVNRKQTFGLDSSEVESTGLVGLKLVFEESSDFFGRITVYDLQLSGIVL
ncbi:galactose-binding like protein [Rhodofomes roseus]|uniref:Galactose-binding like protein n=1 Tax=Rhodofomes roseus TaxID=34475 RepID=A0ABQ8KI55_9APHY|nr:galactose-binding like protein [Rhodofomes roseus]KAH9837389.1 galactose-binding like protein [Rhodofomes roseus]